MKLDRIIDPSKACYSFSEANFFNVLEEVTACKERGDDLHKRRQVNYLFHYLKDLGCKAFVHEERYIDKYYLDDYTHFYATCYRSYKKTCHRFHFFTSDISIDDILDPNRVNDSSLQDSYLGFSVIKPIPNLVGRTLLKVYPETNTDESSGNLATKRHIIALRSYPSNLFGRSLKISSIPFQEQDQIISACATSALWCIIEKTGNEFGYYTPTPFEITNIARESYSLRRSVPSSGLTVMQVINTIQHFGMEVEVVDFKDDLKKKLAPDAFLSLCYAYLRGGFPIFAGVEINKDLHALAILGYHISATQPTRRTLNLVGNKIDKFYIHDDNIGPFTRYDVKSNPPPIQDIFLECDERVTAVRSKIPIKLVSLVIPLYHKIRFPFHNIRDYLLQIMELVLNSKLLPDDDKWEWDTYLTSVNSLKKEIEHSGLYNQMGSQIRRDLLLGFFPRFIWRSILKYDDLPTMEILCDATEAKTEQPLVRVHFFAPPLMTRIKSIPKSICSEYLVDDHFREAFISAIG